MKTARPPLPIVGADQFELLTADGRRLIDGMASWWSVCHGYGHPAIVDAVSEQLHRMPHVMFGGITHEPAERLAGRLAKMLPGDLGHVFFSDSGSVAIEVAMKMAVGYWRRCCQPKRTRFVSFRHAYHGDTTGAMSLCDPDRSMHASYGASILPQFHCGLPQGETLHELPELLERHSSEIAGVFIEPMVQGAGGMRFHECSVVQEIRRTCDEHGVLMIADEIATGFGRTGSMFAIEACDVVPDIICLGKALTAGTTTMAVTVARPHVFNAFWSDDPSDALMHGPTFMANPLACAAANASLDLFDALGNVPEQAAYLAQRRDPSGTAKPEGSRLSATNQTGKLIQDSSLGAQGHRVGQAAAMQSKLSERLGACRDFPGVREVRCRGAIGVIEVQSLPEVDSLRAAFVDAGVWLRPFGDCIYATPPLNLPDAQLDHLCSAMVDVTGDYLSRHFKA